MYLTSLDFPFEFLRKRRFFMLDASTKLSPYLARASDKWTTLLDMHPCQTTIPPSHLLYIHSNQIVGSTNHAVLHDSSTMPCIPKKIVSNVIFPTDFYPFVSSVRLPSCQEVHLHLRDMHICCYQYKSPADVHLLRYPIPVSS